MLLSAHTDNIAQKTDNMDIELRARLIKFYDYALCLPPLSTLLDNSNTTHVYFFDDKIDFVHSISDLKNVNITDSQQIMITNYDKMNINVNKKIMCEMFGVERYEQHIIDSSYIEITRALSSSLFDDTDYIDMNCINFNDSNDSNIYNCNSIKELKQICMFVTCNKFLLNDVNTKNVTYEHDTLMNSFADYMLDNVL